MANKNIIYHITFLVLFMISSCAETSTDPQCLVCDTTLPTDTIKGRVQIFKDGSLFGFTLYGVDPWEGYLLCDSATLYDQFENYKLVDIEGVFMDRCVDSIPRSVRLLDYEIREHCLEPVDTLLVDADLIGLWSIRELRIDETTLLPPCEYPNPRIRFSAFNDSIVHFSSGMGFKSFASGSMVLSGDTLRTFDMVQTLDSFITQAGVDFHLGFCRLIECAFGTPLTHSIKGNIIYVKSTTEDITLIATKGDL